MPSDIDSTTRDVRYLKNLSRIAKNGEGDGIVYSSTGIELYDGGYIEVPLNATIGDEVLKDPDSVDDGWEYLGNNIYKGTNVTGAIKNIASVTNGTFILKAHIYHMEAIDGSMSFEGFTYDAVRIFEKTTSGTLDLHADNFTGYVEVLSVKKILFVDGQLSYYDLNINERVYIGENSPTPLPFSRSYKIVDKFLTGIVYLENRGFTDNDKKIISNNQDVLLTWAVGDDVGFDIGTISETDYVFAFMDEPATIYEVSGDRPSKPTIQTGSSVIVEEIPNDNWKLLTRDSYYMRYSGPEYNLHYIKLEAMDTVTTMSYKSLGYVDTLDLTSPDLDTINITSFNNLFKTPNSINDVHSIENLDTRNGQYFNYAFSYADSSTDLSGLDMGNALEFKYTFINAKGGGNFNFSEWDIGRLGVAEWPFHTMDIDDFPDVSRWNPVRLHRANGFPAIKETETVPPDISRWNLLSLKDGSYMMDTFTGILNPPDLSLWRLPKLQYGFYMFANWRSIKTPPDLSKLGLGNMTASTRMFSDWREVEDVFDISNWNLSKLGTCAGMFANWFKCKTLPDLSRFSGYKRSYQSFLEGWSSLEEANGLEYLELDDWRNYTNVDRMFYGWTSLKMTPNIGGYDTVAVYTAISMMEGWESITDGPDISSWNVKNLKRADKMFKNWKSVTAIPDFSAWSTNSLQITNHMFYGWESATDPVDVSNFKTGSIREASYMFYNWKKLSTPIDVSEWTMSNLQVSSYMFANMESVTEPPDVSGWQTGKLYRASGMFSGLKSITTPPDVSAWNTENLIYADYMFAGWDSIGEIDSLGIENWDIGKLRNCTGMLNGVTLATDYYDTVLLAWEEQITSNDINIPEIDFGNSKYTPDSDAADARQRLLDAGIDIKDGGAAS